MPPHATGRPLRNVGFCALSVCVLVGALARTSSAQMVWAPLTLSTGPSARLTPLVYDVLRDRIVLFSGHPVSPIADTWEWDGTTWQQQLPATSPASRKGHAMVYDLGRQRVLLFGGYSTGPWMLSDTWEWDGTDWSQRFPSTSPSARDFHAMAYDAGRQRAVLFGGEPNVGPHLADTWEWDGTNWFLRQPQTTPPASRGHLMAFDEARNRTVLFGVDSNTWFWDGTNWTQDLQPAPNTRRAAMAYDRGRQRVVLFGGSDGYSASSDTWELDGVGWRLQSPASQPGPREGHGVAYDWARQRTVLFGGWNNVNLGDTWEYHPTHYSIVTQLGIGCGGSAGVPSITHSGPPILGSRDFALTIGSAPPLAVALFALSDASTQQQYGPCTLYLPSLLVLWPVATNFSGLASSRVPIPMNPALSNATFYAQGFVMDPNGAFAGLAFTPGLRVTIGD